MSSSREGALRVTAGRGLPTIVIVGAGASGTLLAVSLLRTRRARVVLLERHGHFGPGLAYTTTSFAHLLNVPAGRMSGLVDAPDDFVEWTRHGVSDAAGNAFLARGLYGQYLADLLERAAAEHDPAALACVPERAVDADLSGERPAVVLASGRRLGADRIVLAVGNMPPVDPPIPGLAEAGEARYIRDPWSRGSTEGIPPDEPVLVIGTGLTMIDVALHLAARGHRGTIHAVSRRGLLPQPHRDLEAPPAHYPAPGVERWPTSALGLLRAVRAHVERAGREGIDWRDALTALRSVTPRLWKSMPGSERARFLRHLQPYWDTHRHRIAPTGFAAIQRMISRGRLRVSAGRIAEVRNTPHALVAVVRARGERTAHELPVARIINCTGPGGDFRRADRPLLNSLFAKGLLCQDELRLGILATDHGAVLDREQRPSEVLWTLGPPLRSMLWETTAIPEIRVQARDLAQRLADLGPLKPS